MSDSVTPWTVACQATLSMEFPRQESGSELPFRPAGYLPHPGIKPTSPAPPALQVDSSPAEPSRKPLTFPLPMNKIPDLPGK